jgi:hypothetical protein
VAAESPAAPVEVRAPSGERAARESRGAFGRDVEVGAAALGVIGPSSSAPGFLFEASAAARPVRLRIGGFFVANQRTDFSGGFATWTRSGVMAGLESVWGQQGPFVAVRADLIAALLTVAGESFDVNRKAQSFDPGAFAGARFGFAWSAVKPYVGAGFAYWFRAQSLSVDGSHASDRLPPFEPRVEIGLVFRVGG